MGAARFAVWSLLLVALQVTPGAAAQDSSCVPGFESDLLIFKVSRTHLRQGTRLGKVFFTDCTDRTRFLLATSDSRFAVQTDGVLTVKRPVVLHEGHRDFFIHSWDSAGQKMTVPVTVLHPGHHGGNHHLNAERHHEAHHHQENPPETGSVTNTQSSADPQEPVIFFPKSGEGLRRRKRDWVIPPLSVTENYRGKYPYFIAQIRSSVDKLKKISYSITGPGADQPPVGLFTMTRETGNLYITQELDREKQDKYILEAHAVAEGAGTAEDPMEIIINVIDQNDNKPVFNQSTYTAEVPEASPKGYGVVTVLATDADEPGNYNSLVHYRIMNQDPELPTPDLFTINPVTGLIRVNEAKLNYEKYKQYTLTVSATDNQGEGLSTDAKVIIKVTDSNDHAPVFTEASYTGAVEENDPNAEVVRMSVTDSDEPNTPAWNAVFKITAGDPGNFFSVKTGINKQEGIISTVKGLDFEKASTHTLIVTVVNEVPFVGGLTTSSATVTVTVKDVNEAPIFDPKEQLVSRSESLPLGSVVVRYTASDPDTARRQKVMYKILNDRAGWLDVDKETGLIKVKSEMDRESPFVQDNKYTALIGAYDDDQVPATGTGTLFIELQDVNDNPPTIVEREFRVCNKKPAAQLLTVTDKDGPGFTYPYSVALRDTAKANWSAVMNGTRTGIILNLKTELESGQYHVAMAVSDNQGLSQVSTVTATVCDCTGEDVNCQEMRVGGTNLPVILGILGGVLLLLMLVLLLLLFARRKTPDKELLLPPEDDIRDEIRYYDEEGGGEDDQDFDLSVLHRGLDNRPGVFRDDVAPVFMPQPTLYKPRPTNPDEIGSFIEDNMKVADNDPTAPPYDSLLVFDYEGGGSEAGSLSSINSSSSGDQDYNCLNDWGPRFKKLADMYGGGEDDDMM